MSEDSKMINHLFDEEILKFHQEPPLACDHKTALKLLREFNRDSIDFGEKFWPGSVEKYLPAVAEGTMFLSEELFEHKEALTTAEFRAENSAYTDVAHAFIYGVARGIPAYRTALPAYLHIKSIPDHADEHLLPDSAHISPYCDICNFHSASIETKLRFMWINSMQYNRIYLGGYLGTQGVDNSSFLLREFGKMPIVASTKEDFKVFTDSLKLAEQLPESKKVGSYKELLQKSGMLNFKAKEYQPYLDILGYLDILHTDEHRGISKRFIRACDMQEPEEYKNDYDYPVRFWRAKNGVDWSRVHELFDRLYN